jgi:hypothetical protein
MKYTYETKGSDNYRTPKRAWEDIQQWLPRDKVVWEAFYGDGVSARYLRELGCQVVSEDVDFFTSDFGDVIVSNPPFSIAKAVLTRLKKLGKPFILIMPCCKMNSGYFRELFKGQVQIIVPKKRIHFEKFGGDCTRNCSFDCHYYCYKMELPSDLMWVD